MASQNQTVFACVDFGNFYNHIAVRVGETGETTSLEVEKSVVYLTVLSTDEGDTLQASCVKPVDDSGVEYVEMFGIKQAVGRSNETEVHHAMVERWKQLGITLVHVKSCEMNVCFQGAQVSVTQVASMVVKRIIDNLLDVYPNNPLSVCITVPVSFQTQVRDAYRDMLTKCLPPGTPVVVVNEPFAAHLATVKATGANKEFILMNDFGHGTSDYALILVERQEGRVPSCKLLCTYGSGRFAGHAQTDDLLFYLNNLISKAYEVKYPMPVTSALEQWVENQGLYMITSEEAENIHTMLAPAARNASYRYALSNEKMEALDRINASNNFKLVRGMDLPATAKELMDHLNSNILAKYEVAFKKPQDDAQARRPARSAVSMPDKIAEWTRHHLLYRLTEEQVDAIKIKLTKEPSMPYTSAVHKNKRTALENLGFSSTNFFKLTHDWPLDRIFEKKSSNTLRKDLTKWIAQITPILQHHTDVPINVTLVGGAAQGVGVSEAVNGFYSRAFPPAKYPSLTITGNAKPHTHVAFGGVAYLLATLSNKPPMTVDDHVTTTCFGILHTYADDEPGQPSKVGQVTHVILKKDTVLPATEYSSILMFADKMTEVPAGEEPAGKEPLGDDEDGNKRSWWRMLVPVVEGNFEKGVPKSKLHDATIHNVYAYVPYDANKKSCKVKFTATKDRKLLVEMEVDNVSTVDTINFGGASGSGGGGVDGGADVGASGSGGGGADVGASGSDELDVMVVADPGMRDSE